MRKYTVNEEFFSKWTPEMAYVLGFIYADGNMSKEAYKVRLHSIDKQILENIKTVMQSEHPVTECRRANHLWYELSFNIKRIYSDLRNLGVYPNKSLTIRFPKIPKEVLPHFIRGYFDGDGCIYETKNRKRCKTPGLEISLASGSKDFAEPLVEILQKEVHSTFKLYIKRKKYFIVVGWNKASEAFYDYVYKDSTICLERKKIKFENIFSKRS